MKLKISQNLDINFNNVERMTYSEKDNTLTVYHTNQIMKTTYNDNEDFIEGFSNFKNVGIINIDDSNILVFNYAYVTQVHSFFGVKFDSDYDCQLSFVINNIPITISKSNFVKKDGLKDLISYILANGFTLNKDM